MDRALKDCEDVSAKHGNEPVLFVFQAGHAAKTMITELTEKKIRSKIARRSREKIRSKITRKNHREKDTLEDHENRYAQRSRNAKNVRRSPPTIQCLFYFCVFS
jgi:hypothetical protein